MSLLPLLAEILHAGLTETMRAIFLIRNQPLICFSRSIALRISSNRSKYARRSSLYFEAKQDPVPILCSRTLRTRLFVTPVCF